MRKWYSKIEKYVVLAQVLAAVLYLFCPYPVEWLGKTIVVCALLTLLAHGEISHS